MKGYTLKNKSYIDFYHANAYYYIHDVTGAELIHFDCDDKNKVFAVGFNTIPDDDTGVAHIVEHCVLCGSRKYPLKELFGTLAKNSLNTYLNAMTFPDKTLYPLASQNDKDFMNLINVYLDAVFNPTMYDDELFFRQEGHSFDFSGEGDPMPSGVVYNEMKGAMSDPSSIAGEIANRELFTNSYKYNSGGDPDAVLDLKYEDFIAFHKKHYHPSNARFFVYGDADINSVAELLESYIGCFEKAERISELDANSLCGEPKYATGEYLTTDETGIATIKFVIGDSYDRTLGLSANALSRSIFENDASPLKKNLIESGFCSDLFAYADDSRSATVFSVTLYGTKELSPQKIEARVFDELRKIDSDFITRNIKAELSRMKFELLENDFGSVPRGMIPMYGTMLYTRQTADPFFYHRIEKFVDEVQSAFESGAHLRWIDSFLLGNPNRVTVVLAPNSNIQEKDQSYRWNELTQEQKALERQWYDRLRERQDTPDSEEALASLPKIGLSDVPRENRRKDARLIAESDTKLLYYPVDTRVIYAKFFMPFGELKLEELSMLSAMVSMLAAADTQKYSLEEIVYLSKMYSGGMKFGMLFADGKSYITVDIRTLPEHLSKNLEMVSEILRNTKLDDIKRLRELLIQTRTRMQVAFINYGDTFAVEQALARFHTDERNNYCSNGIGYYKWVCGSLDMDDDAFADMAARAALLLKDILRSGSMTVGIGLDERNFDAAAERLKSFVDSLSCGAQKDFPKSTVVLESGNEGFVVPSSVQYVARSVKLPEKVLSDGVFLVLKSFLFSEFLWPEIRMKGGAYGASCLMTRRGGVVFSSYRDPNLKRTLDSFASIADFVLDRGISEQELETAKLGALSNIDQPVSPSKEALSAIDRYFWGIGAEKLHMERTQVYNATTDDFMRAARELKRFIADGKFCVVGGEAEIEFNRDLFDSVEKI